MARPVRLGGRAQRRKHLRQLVQIRGAREVGAAQQELREDAAQRPHVHRAAVLPRAEQQLRRTVPPLEHLRVLEEER